MGMVETALLRPAGAVVTPAVKRWLGRRREQRERETPLIELIGAGIVDDLGVRRAGRRLEDIVDTVYERLQLLVRRREPALPDNEITAALNAVADTLQRRGPVRRRSVRRRCRSCADGHPTAPTTARHSRAGGLSEAAGHLYGRVLDECCTCLTQLVVQLPPFQGRATVQRSGTADHGGREPHPGSGAPTGDQLGRPYRDQS